jgi:hypothetical protein
MGLIPTLFDFVEGTPAYPDQVDSNFAAIRNVVNGNLTAENLASSAVTAGKLATLPRARAILDAYNHLGGQGGTPVLLGAAGFDTDNMYDDVNDYFTVVTAGIYVVHMHLQHVVFGPGSISIERRPGGSGTPVVIGGAGGPASYATSALTCTAVDYFAAGDRMNGTWFNNGGGQNGVASGFFLASWISP